MNASFTQFGALSAAAAKASDDAGPFTGLNSLGAADEAEARRAGQFARSVQHGAQRAQIADQLATARQDDANRLLASAYGQPPNVVEFAGRTAAELRAEGHGGSDV